MIIILWRLLSLSLLSRSVKLSASPWQMIAHAFQVDPMLFFSPPSPPRPPASEIPSHPSRGGHSIRSLVLHKRAEARRPLLSLHLRWFVSTGFHLHWPSQAWTHPRKSPDDLLAQVRVDRSYRWIIWETTIAIWDSVLSGSSSECFPSWTCLVLHTS